MNPAFWLPFYMFFILWLINNQRAEQDRQLAIIRRKKNRTNRKRGNTAVNEMIKTLIGKVCFIWINNGSSYKGTILRAEDGWIALQTSDGTELINVDYVCRLREAPPKKVK